MQITLSTKELDEAIILWLGNQGFSADSYDITTRIIAGRSTSTNGTRVDVTLDPIEPTMPVDPTTRKFGISPSEPTDV